MKILSITAQKPDSTGSGVYLTELVKALDAQGHTQAIIAGVTKSDAIQFPEQVTIYPVYYESEQMPFPIAGMSDEMPYRSTRYSDMTEVMFEQFKDAFGKQIKHAITEFAPDAILCHHLYLLAAITRDIATDIPVFGMCHGSDLRQIKKNPKKRDYIIPRIQKLNGIFALHEEQKQQICEYFDCSETLVTVIGTGYNNNVFYVDSSVSKDSTTLSLLFAGKISEKKGVKSLLSSLRHIHCDLHVSLAGGYGDKQEYDTIQQLAYVSSQSPEANKQVYFLGKLSHAELAREMNRHDIFVLPSFYEGLPLVIMEALACGMKVVCTDLPGIKPWLDANLPENEVVFVTPPEMRNEDEPVEDALAPFEKRLADAILTATNANPERVERMQKLSWAGLAETLVAHIAKHL